MSTCNDCNRLRAEVTALQKVLQEKNKALGRRDEQLQQAVRAEGLKVAQAALTERIRDLRRVLFRVVQALDEGRPLDEPLRHARTVVQLEARRAKGGR